MFQDQILELENRKWLGWKTHIKGLRDILISTLKVVWLEKPKIKVVSQEDKKVQVWESSLLSERYWMTKPSASWITLSPAWKENLWSFKVLVMLEHSLLNSFMIMEVVSLEWLSMMAPSTTPWELILMNYRFIRKKQVELLVSKVPNNNGMMRLPFSRSVIFLCQQHLRRL